MEGEVPKRVGNAESHYNRFAISQRKMLSVQPAYNLPDKNNIKYHRNADIAKIKAASIDKEVTTQINGDGPSPKHYKKSTIFDAEKLENSPQGYRGTNNENMNKIINNNTQFRIFNQIQPRDNKIAPLENMNINPNRWKPKLTYYYQENKGDIINPAHADNDGRKPNQLLLNTNRDSRLLNSKRQLQNYLSSSLTGKDKLAANESKKIYSKSALDRQPDINRRMYASIDPGRNSQINKTYENTGNNNLELFKTVDVKYHNNVPNYPVLDVQRRVIKEHQTDIEKLRSRRYETIQNNDLKSNPKPIHRPKSIDVKPLIIPSNAVANEAQKRQSIDLSLSTNKQGGLTYRNEIGIKPNLGEV